MNEKDRLHKEGRHLEAESQPTWYDRFREWREEIAVRWFMLDAQQKQAVIIIGLTLYQGVVEVISARLSRTTKEGK